MTGGDRTRDLLDHNQALYQLSYRHHEDLVDTRPVRPTGLCRRSVRGEELNLHDLVVTSPSSWRVYQFRHPRWVN